MGMGSGLHLGIDGAGADQVMVLLYSICLGTSGTMTNVPSGRQEEIQHKIECSSVSERRSQDAPEKQGVTTLHPPRTLPRLEWCKCRTQQAEAGLSEAKTRIQSDFWASLGYIRPHLKEKSKFTQQDTGTETPNPSTPHKA